MECSECKMLSEKDLLSCECKNATLVCEECMNDHLCICNSCPELDDVTQGECQKCRNYSHKLIDVYFVCTTKCLSENMPRRKICCQCYHNEPYSFIIGVKHIKKHECICGENLCPDVCTLKCFICHGIVHKVKLAFKKANKMCRTKIPINICCACEFNSPYKVSPYRSEKDQHLEHHLPCKDCDSPTLLCLDDRKQKCGNSNCTNATSCDNYQEIKNTSVCCKCFPILSVLDYKDENTHGYVMMNIIMKETLLLSDLVLLSMQYIADIHTIIPNLTNLF